MLILLKENGVGGRSLLFEQKRMISIPRLAFQLLRQIFERLLRFVCNHVQNIDINELAEIRELFLGFLATTRISISQILDRFSVALNPDCLKTSMSVKGQK